MSERGKLRTLRETVFFHLQPTESSIGLIGSCFCWEDKAKIMEDIRPLFDGDEVLFCGGLIGVGNGGSASFFFSGLIYGISSRSRLLVRILFEEIRRNV